VAPYVESEWSRPVNPSDVSCGGDASPPFCLTRLVDKVGRKTEVTLVVASSSKSALSPARQRTNSTNQWGRPPPGTGSGVEGSAEIRHLVVATVG
jgi:hypothetical protein